MPAVFVHVSDIHFGQEKDDRIYIHKDVKRELIADAREMVGRIGKGGAHGVLVTGDIAHSGEWLQYEDAGKWLDELAAGIGVEAHQVQMVPGNHDLDRKKTSFAAGQILDHIRRGGPAELEAILSNDIDRAALFERFEDYGRFSFAYDCPLNNEGAFASEMEVVLAPGRAIRFIRLNSSLLCTGKEQHEHPELMIGARQFTIPRVDGVENIILVHHPLHWYKDEKQVRDYIRSRARVLISGHEHNPKVVVEEVESGSDLMLLAAGATVPFESNDTYTFTYNIIEFDWDETIDGLSVTMYPRAWNPERTRFEDDPVRLGGREPMFRLNCPQFRRVAKPQASEVVAAEVGSAVDVHTGSADPVIEMVPVEPSAPEYEAMPNNIEGYENARLRFFRDLLEVERLKILVELGALDGTHNERMNQGLERRLLDSLVRGGELARIEHMIDQIIGERE